MKTKSKTKKAGRVHTALPISLQREEIEEIDSRVRELGSQVNNRSHYFRRLIEADRRFNLIGNEKALEACFQQYPAEKKQGSNLLSEIDRAVAGEKPPEPGAQRPKLRRGPQPPERH